MTGQSCSKLFIQGTKMDNRIVEEGAGAYREGMDSSENPYKEGSAENLSWQAGWNDEAAKNDIDCDWV